VSAELSADQCYAAPGDEATLVQAAQADPAAFAALYARYYTRVFRYLRARTAGTEEAADLTQQVFLQVLDALPRYQERGLPFAAWLFRIAANAATDAHRRRRPSIGWHVLSGELPGDDGDPERAALQQERLERLRALVARLDETQRELLALRFAAGLSAREIAAVAGKREGAVKRRLTRIIQRLREQYGDA
jgi:RNA polymerase sigma-70 factor (ECF subfamily)